jgi:D-glycero-D-manno-heptose 1,7-bisphosphate phosphatase
MRHAVFLDRDGVINRSIVRDGKPFAPTSLEQIEVLPQVSLALSQLRQAGFLNIVVTNQPDIATGKQSWDELERIHRKLQSDLCIDAIRVCPHVEAQGCDCRKPKPGLIAQAAAEFNIDIGSSYMVGDRWRDISAGQRAGCKQSFFIDYGYHEKRPDGDFVTARDLAQAAQYILGGT